MPLQVFKNYALKISLLVKALQSNEMFLFRRVRKISKTDY